MQLGRSRGRGRPDGASAVRLLALVVAAAATATGLAVPARAAGAELGVENLRVGFASNTRNNMYRIGNWTPVWVQIRGGAERFAGFLEIEVPDDDGTPTFVRQPIEVAPGDTPPRFVVYVRPGGREVDLKVRLRNARGRVVVDANGPSLAQIDPVMPDETVLLTLGKPQGVDQVAKLPGFTADSKSGGGEIITVARFDDAGLMPGRWYGYDAAEAVILDTNDKEIMAALVNRGQALADWVSRGGHLVVAVSGNWQAVRDSVLGPLLPAVPTGQEQVTTLSGLETFAGQTKPIMPAGSGRVTVAKLEQIESRGGKVLGAVGSVPLVVRGAYGFGRVTLLGVDVDQKPFSDWPDRALFWVRAVDLRRPAADASGPGNVRIGGGGRRMYQAGVSDLASQLRQALEQFPGVKLVPFGWVAFFIFLYILLIGPGDYLFLKKVVKRMELTWVTFPLIVLTVSLAAYVAAYAVKGKELRVNKVDVLDVDGVSGQSRGSTFINIFSPQNRDYGVAVVPQPLDRPAPAEPLASPTGPPALPPQTEVQLSWMGMPEPGFGGMTGTRVGFSGGGYSYDPPGSLERIEGLRIPIWSTKALTARWYGPTAPVAEADLEPVGTDRLAGTVTNKLDIPLNDAKLAFGKQVYQLGTIAPGATVRVELSSDRQLSGLLKSESGSYMPGKDFSTQGSKINRANLIMAVMFHDSQGTTAERVLSSDPLRYLDLTGQLALDRPMLVARVDRPAARLVLDNAPANPKLDETTVVRVILPLKTKATEPETRKAP
jgi:hypothetical protein